MTLLQSIEAACKKKAGTKRNPCFAVFGKSISSGDRLIPCENETNIFTSLFKSYQNFDK